MITQVILMNCHERIMTYAVTINITLLFEVFKKKKEIPRVCNGQNKNRLVFWKHLKLVSALCHYF